MSFVTSVCMLTWKTLVPINQIFKMSDIRNFYLRLTIHSSSDKSQTKIIHTLHEDLPTIMTVLITVYIHGYCF
jgi:hypothetical protein